MSDNYTIEQQYHAQKGVYIYVVRLSVQVQKEKFDELRALAKTYGGYYSSFRGVHGFVFSNEKNAISFGKELNEHLATLYETSKNDNIVVSINTLNGVSNNTLPLTIVNTKINSKWSRKMNDDQTNDFFLSITEYDNWGEIILKVKMKNLGYYINTCGQLTISCEIYRTDVSDRWANLFVAIYDSKNRIREKDIVDYLQVDMISKPCICSCTEIEPSQIGKIKLFWE